MNSTQLSERNLKLLTSLVERYIRDGVPVGSKTLSQEVALSPASVRNVMAELEEAGLISSPHTSAGRVPTDLGYRLFVDTVVTANSPQDDSFVSEVQAHLKADMPAAKLVESASGLLSAITHQAGLVMLPRARSPSFRQIEFLPLSSQRVLVILVLNEQDVQNRIIHTDRNYTQDELHRAAVFINQHFSGGDLDAVRDSLLRSMREDKSVIDSPMQTAIDVAARALEQAGHEENDYVVAGQANLLQNQLGSAPGGQIDSAEEMKRLGELFEAFQHKKDILHLMERCTRANGVQIFIGEESGYDVLGDFSVVTAPYSVDGQGGKGVEGQALGVLGVIGPMRMAYDRVIPMVDVTAKLLSAALKG